MHDCAELYGIQPGQGRDHLALQDRSQPGRLPSTEENGIQNQEIIRSLRSPAINHLIAGASWTDVTARLFEDGERWAKPSNCRGLSGDPSPGYPHAYSQSQRR